LNRGDCASYVLDRLTIPSSDTAKVGQVDQLINTFIYRVNADYNLTVASATVTVTASTGLVTLPSDFQKIVSLTQTTVSIDVTDELTFQARVAAIAAGTAASVTNPPTLAVFRPPLTLATLPIPTANVSATLVYVQRPTPPATDGTTIPLPVEYHDLIAELVVRRMALTEGEPAIAQIALDLANEMRQELGAIRTQQPGQAGWAIPLKGYSA
jgi:hypothetical protein